MFHFINLHQFHFITKFLEKFELNVETGYKIVHNFLHLKIL
jgi:hypothetical protein